jgi:hypothetical protein
MELARPPIASSLSVREARQAYLDENGFTVEAYDARWTDASFFGIPLRVPNTARHRFAIMLHDLHHVATGYGTDLAGEAEISAWELRTVRSLGLYVGTIVTLGALMGLAVAPRRTVAAFRAGSRGAPLFGRIADEAAYATLLTVDVGHLRRQVGVPLNGLVSNHCVHDRAPSS